MYNFFFATLPVLIFRPLPSNGKSRKNIVIHVPWTNAVLFVPYQHKQYKFEVNLEGDKEVILDLQFFEGRYNTSKFQWDIYKIRNSSK